MNREQALALIDDFGKQVAAYWDYFESSTYSAEEHRAIERRVDAAREKIVEALTATAN